ncbi:MAG TPA: hypothetical protein VL403_10700, partial [Candidatus Kryptonia bacterium]|nr:hypothetical protein [Candidatus Kryptonia bacterium]
MRLRLMQLAAAWTVVAVLAGCGGGGSSGGASAPPGSIGVQPEWPQPDGSTGAALPSAVKTLQIVFRSEVSDFACCLAVDPTMVPINPTTGQRALILDQLPPGAGTYEIAGFATDFAPAPDGVTAICATVPPGVGAQCDPTRPATPAFDSGPVQTNIIPGSIVRGNQIEMRSLPFVFDLDPALLATSPSPVTLQFTAADAQTGIAGDSIAAEVFFRSLSKRSPLTLHACDDSTDTPCSQDGTLKVKGFRAVGVPLVLPEGPAEVHITAQNLADPPRDLDFSYDFTVFPGAAEGGE